MKANQTYYLGTTSLLLASLALAACSGPTPAVVAPPVSTVTATPTATASTTAATAEAPPESGPAIKLYPVARVDSLLDITETEGTIEARIGTDPGGGIIGRYRYVPIVDGALDFSQETSEVMYVNTASYASVHLAGKRPSLVRHAASGFRSAASDMYWALGEDGAWTELSRVSADDIGAGLFSWSEDRILEWRVPQGNDAKPGEPPRSVLTFRVVRGQKKAAPTIPGALRKRLEKEGFFTTDVAVFKTGEVLVTGNLSGAAATAAKGESGKIGTLVWRDDLKSPDYFTIPRKASGVGEEEAEDPMFLGGASLASVRMRDGDRVLKLEGSTWVEESTVAENGLPDVWFGKPLVLRGQEGFFARMTQGAAWTPFAPLLPEDMGEMEAFQLPGPVLVDAAGVLWTTVGPVLLSNKQPASKMLEITEDDIVKWRKASVLRGGAMDATHDSADSGVVPTCSLWHVLLARGPVPEKDTSDYPEVRALLKGHAEWSAAKLVVSRERGEQLLGAQIKDEKLANAMGGRFSKKGKRGVGDVVCAEPAVVRQIKIDFATGDVAK